MRTWILQANLRDRAFLARLKVELDALDEVWCEVPVVPFSADLPALPFPVEERAVICYGPSFVPRIASAPAWRPGIFFDNAAFRWSAMSARWGDLMFSPDGTLATIAEVVERMREAPEALFVRPDADSKAFDGGPCDDEAALRARIAEAPADTPVVWAHVRPVDAEWRCFVVGGEVVDASEYRRAGRPSLFRGAPPRAIDLAERAAARWVPAAVTCIDVASSGDHFGVVEANCFNASRFYGRRRGDGARGRRARGRLTISRVSPCRPRSCRCSATPRSRPRSSA